MTKSPYKFIAGAVCPQCHQSDVMRLNQLDQSIECVDCGYQQTAEQRDQSARSKLDKTPRKQSAISMNKVNKVKLSAKQIIPVTQIKSDD